jgi:hypothetical protein
VLRNLTLSIEDASGPRSRTISREALVPTLRETFGLDVPLDARFRALDSD